MSDAMNIDASMYDVSKTVLGRFSGDVFFNNDQTMKTVIQVFKKNTSHVRLYLYLHEKMLVYYSNLPC